MRLDLEQQRAIREVVAQSDPQAEVFLFGSRAKDTERGGDIDLLIMSSKIDPGERRRIKLMLIDRLGPQKIDLLVAPNAEKAFVRIALQEGMKL